MQITYSTALGDPATLDESANNQMEGHIYPVIGYSVASPKYIDIDAPKIQYNHVTPSVNQNFQTTETFGHITLTIVTAIVIAGRLQPTKKLDFSPFFQAQSGTLSEGMIARAAKAVPNQYSHTVGRAKAPKPRALRRVNLFNNAAQLTTPTTTCHIIS